MQLVRDPSANYSTFPLFSVFGLGPLFSVSISPEMLLLLCNIAIGVYLFLVLVHAAIIFPTRTLPLLRFVYHKMPKHTAPHVDWIRYCEFWVLLTSWCIYAALSFVVVPSLLLWGAYVNDLLYWQLTELSLDIATYFPQHMLALLLGTLKYGVTISVVYLFQISVAWSNYTLYYTASSPAAATSSPFSFAHNCCCAILAAQNPALPQPTDHTAACTLLKRAFPAMTRGHWLTYLLFCALALQYTGTDALMMPVIVVGLPVLSYCIGYFFARELEVDAQERDCAARDEKKALMAAATAHDTSFDSLCEKV